MQTDLLKKLKFSGLLYQYYKICKRKLWLFFKGIRFAQYCDDVIIGRELAKSSLRGKKGELKINEQISIDRIDLKRRVIYEIKKSSAGREAHILQVKYYLYYLFKMGLPGFSGVITYPREFHRLVVHPLLDQEIQEFESIFKEIDDICNSLVPPMVVSSKYCRGCSYREFCYS